ncbi:esterase/lipase family protein [Aquariibacter albus]|uniref:Alpha/beta hydrolase n=1 Tax=Aquariibacter albus TaxID=2759899 RepID=A0A839HV61_9BURK|nr:hypothetical protein [Aquariibacter albus]MBB1162294.1 hypothetical protein [Aquariibacter albus]
MKTPRLVVTIHGIRTRGSWQKDLTPHLARMGLVPIHLDYGWFGALRFAWPFTRQAQIERVRHRLLELVETTGCRKPCIVAHSFGTLQVMEALRLENGNLRFDRVVLSGSILPLDWPWATLLSQGWVGVVRNERALGDRAVGLAGWVARHLPTFTQLKAGPSGRQPFPDPPESLLDWAVEGGHSEVHNVTKYGQWARFLAYPVLDERLLDKVQRELAQMRQVLSSLLGIDAATVRANLMAPRGGTLRMVPGASDNMLHAPEFDLSLEPGHGCAGQAFESGEVQSARLVGAHWSAGLMPQEELAKLHPDLCWVLSFPVRSAQRKRVVAVMTLDGLAEMPGLLRDPAAAPAQQIVATIKVLLERRLSPLLDLGFRGELPPELDP